MTAANDASKATADKLAYWEWVIGQPGLSPPEFRVLSFIVHRLLGLDGQVHWRGWTFVGVIADHSFMGESSARKALASLEAKGWLKRHSVHGVGGRVFFEISKVKDAATLLTPRPLSRDHNASGVENLSSQRGLSRRKPLALERKTSRSREVNPSDRESSEQKEESSERARGGAGASETASPQGGSINDQGLGKGLRQEGEPLVLTAATARLLKRIEGVAKKGGIDVDVARFLQERRDKIQRWLRLQREEKEAALFQEIREELELHVGCDPVAFGVALATPKPKRKPKSEYSPRFLEALAGPASTPRKPLVFTADALRASAERLGIKPKAS